MALRRCVWNVRESGHSVCPLPSWALHGHGCSEGRPHRTLTPPGRWPGWPVATIRCVSVVVEGQALALRTCQFSSDNLCHLRLLEPRSSQGSHRGSGRQVDEQVVVGWLGTMTCGSHSRAGSAQLFSRLDSKESMGIDTRYLRGWMSPIRWPGVRVAHHAR